MNIPNSVKIDYHQIDLLASQQHSAEFLAYNPNGTVPALIVEYDGDSDSDSVSPITITQSLSILDFLENTFPEPALLPPVSSPSARAKVLELVSLLVADVQAPTSIRVRRQITEMGADSKLYANTIHARGLDVYESLIGRGGGTKAGLYSVGDSITWADICLVPAVESAARSGVRLDGANSERWPLTKAVFERCIEHEAFRKAGMKGI